MRKIEQQMVDALIANKKHWASGNTQVDCAPDGRSTVHLHGNLIAIIDAGNVSVTLAGWPTPTTRSRVNTLLGAFGVNARVYQHKGAQWLQGDSVREIASDEWVKV